MDGEGNGTPLQYSLLLGISHRRRSLVGCSPRGLEESDMTERLHLPFSLSCIGEGNGNPLQCSCLENPRDGGACWAAVYGVTQNRTRLKRLSSSSSSHMNRSEGARKSCKYNFSMCIHTYIYVYVQVCIFRRIYISIRNKPILLPP